MPNTESCKKRLRQDAKRQERNNYVKRTLQTLTKKIHNNIEINEKEELLSKLYSKLDKAVKAGVVHKKTASRKKSRLSIYVKKEKNQQPQE